MPPMLTVFYESINFRLLCNFDPTQFVAVKHAGNYEYDCVKRELEGS
jgi:hypothetical protein